MISCIFVDKFSKIQHNNFSVYYGTQTNNTETHICSFHSENV